MMLDKFSLLNTIDELHDNQLAAKITEARQSVIEDFGQWLDDQIDIATEESLHTGNDELMSHIITTKIVAYNLAKQKLWEMETLAEDESEQE